MKRRRKQLNAEFELGDDDFQDFRRNKPRKGPKRS